MAITKVPAEQTGGMTLLSTTTLSGASTTISGIDGAYTDLRIVGRNIDLNTGDDLYFRVNGDTASNYVSNYYKNATGTITGARTVASYYFLGSAGDSSGYNVAGCFVMDIPRYSVAEIHQFHSRNWAYAGGNQLFYLTTGTWATANALTSITIFTAGGATYDAGTVYIYGVK